MFKKIVVVGMAHAGISVAVEFTNAGFDVEYSISASRTNIF